MSFYRFAPLVRSVARRYAGRGAELDLISHASCDVLELILSCPDDKSRALHLSQNLPGKVRDAAAKLRRQADHGSIEELSDSGYEPEDLRPNYTLPASSGGNPHRARRLPPGGRPALRPAPSGDSQRPGLLPTERQLHDKEAADQATEGQHNPANSAIASRKPTERSVGFFYSRDPRERGFSLTSGGVSNKIAHV
nr:hypothetical protein [uncultured Dethiosulfovibrio sp.]